jgi:hypothetical protein
MKQPNASIGYPENRALNIPHLADTTTPVTEIDAAVPTCHDTL